MMERLMLLYTPLAIVLFGCIWPIVSGFRSKSKEKLLSPLVFAGLIMFYYIIMSYAKYNIDENNYILDGISKVLWGAAIYVMSYFAGFNIKLKRKFFSKSNLTFENVNNRKLGILLFLIGFATYALINGFSFDVISEQDYGAFDPEASYGHLSSYLTKLVSLFPIAFALCYIGNVPKVVLAFMFSIFLAISLMSGSRWGLAFMLLFIGTFYYLWPKFHMPNFLVIGVLAVSFYFFMGIVEFTRNYGSGLDIEKLSNLDTKRVSEGAAEGTAVFMFSAAVMKDYKVDDFIYFEPLSNALLMPLPRQFFPNKPKGLYMREANMRIYNTIAHGAAFLSFAEGYISFGWLGIILYGLLLGIGARIFWDNYLNNRTLGSILLLASFNAWLYVLISRGYLAQSFMNFVYSIPIPFWVTWLLSRFIRTKPSLN